MAVPADLSAIPGSRELHDWFGYWPTFHDAEVISLHLNRASVSILKLHTWEMTNDVDETGHYVSAKHVVVEFFMELAGDDADLDLRGFNHQNVMSQLLISKRASGYRLDIGECYGLAGTINTANLTICLTPGLPG